MRTLTFFLLITSLCQSAVATEKPERSAILEVIRPVAAKLANQPIRLKVDRLNQDQDWAVLVGELVGRPNQTINWELAEGCHPELDKMLWVVLNKAHQTWHVKHIEICASEPPYWYMDQYGGLIWPCGVYAGLDDTSGSSLEKECRSERGKRRN